MTFQSAISSTVTVIAGILVCLYMMLQNYKVFRRQITNARVALQRGTRMQKLDIFMKYNILNLLQNFANWSAS